MSDNVSSFMLYIRYFLPDSISFVIYDDTNIRKTLLLVSNFGLDLDPLFVFFNFSSKGVVYTK